MAAILKENTLAGTHAGEGRYLHAAMETMPREALAALQLERLRETVRNAYTHVPMQRVRLDALGVRPDDIRSLADIQHLPFTVKTDLRDHYPFGMFARPQGQLTRLHASSGTTGKPTVVGYTPQDISHWADLMARSLFAAGARPGDVVHNAYGYGLFTGGLGAHYGAERLGAVVVPMSGGSTERQVALIMDFGARVLCATPSYALALAEVAESQGVDLRKSALRVGLFGAEPWSQAMRSEIEARLGLLALDIYGLSEIMGPGVACECECRNGLHGWEDHFLFEVIDPETGQVLPEGQAGELVITTLTKQALPMLRYRTRDITRLSSTRCDCGRTHLRILRITGRNDDMLIIRGVNLFPTQIEELVLQHGQLSGQYQLVVTREALLDEVTVRCELAPEHRHAAPGPIAAELQQRIKTLIGVSTTVDVGLPDSIERTLVGKARRVVDKRSR